MEYSSPGYRGTGETAFITPIVYCIFGLSMSLLIFCVSRKKNQYSFSRGISGKSSNTNAIMTELDPSKAGPAKADSRIDIPSLEKLNSQGSEKLSCEILAANKKKNQEINKMNSVHETEETNDQLEEKNEDNDEKSHKEEKRHKQKKPKKAKHDDQTEEVSAASRGKKRKKSKKHH